MALTTLPEKLEPECTRSSFRIEQTGLSVLWSRDEPARMGELLLLPAGDPGPWTFGRGEARGDDRRLALVRQRPGERVPTGPLLCSRISRAQLRLSLTPEGALVVENIGACRLVHRGCEVPRTTMAPGDTFSLGNELLFMCVRRPATLPVMAEEPGGPLHTFGSSDGFGLVGESAPIWDLRQRIRAVARTPFHVLILGESGAGKELVAQALHACSARGHRPIVARNAATIPEGLADAELFGNLRNYPNPGMPERPGLVGEAHESTLFLDEFAELPKSLQAHLLRLMDNGEYQRLGESIKRKSNLRIVAATNRPTEEIKHDVLARLKVHISVPDLNSRREDIPLLIVHLLRRHAAENRAVAERFFPNGALESIPLVSPVLMEALVLHRYTTHVRELDALLIRAALESQGQFLELSADMKRVLKTTRPMPMALCGLDALTPEESSRLALLRHHRLSPTACGHDRAYPGNRQTADLHLRQLICKILAVADWDAEKAASLLAGNDDPELCYKARARIGTFLSNVGARFAPMLDKAYVRTEAGDAKASREGMLQVVEALRNGRLKGWPQASGAAYR